MFSRASRIAPRSQSLNLGLMLDCTRVSCVSEYRKGHHIFVKAKVKAPSAKRKWGASSSELCRVQGGILKRTFRVTVKLLGHHRLVTEQGKNVRELPGLNDSTSYRSMFTVQAASCQRKRHFHIYIPRRIIPLKAAKGLAGLRPVVEADRFFVSHVLSSFEPCSFSQPA